MWEGLRYLVLSLTSRCNLRCSYCYQAATASGKDMADEIIDQALELYDTGQKRILQLSGGEPTLVPEKIYRIVKRCGEMKNPPQLAIQTNATVLDKGLLDLFKMARIQIGISLDGPPDLQERLRGRADATLQGMRLLEEANIPFRVTTVLSSANVVFLDRLVLLLAGFGQCRGIGLDLMVAKGRARETGLAMAGPAQLNHGLLQMEKALSLVNGKRKIPLVLREKEHLSRKGAGDSFCHAATGTSLAVSPAGKLFPCGQTMGDSSFAMGTLGKPEKTKAFLPLSSARLRPPLCADCDLAANCPGDCPSRIHYNKEQQAPLSCVLYSSLSGRKEVSLWS